MSRLQVPEAFHMWSILLYWAFALWNVHQDVVERTLTDELQKVSNSRSKVKTLPPAQCSLFTPFPSQRLAIPP
jgi:hypothetical protein